MHRDDDFSELFERIRRGDADAAGVIVRRFETAVRVAVRLRLTDPALRRQLDSMDVCQSVLASFFLAAATGAYDLHEPRQLVALLVRMAQNKLAMHARDQYRQRRDVRRLDASFRRPEQLASPDVEPIRHVAGRELLERALEMMTAETRGIAERRMSGESWLEIASHCGGTPDARRKQYERAVARIADELDLSAMGG
jgi:DNA-directed RNA polymerase specialized sigma24 family protein